LIGGLSKVTRQWPTTDLSTMNACPESLIRIS
jgi:hypothetical protein